MQAAQPCGLLDQAAGACYTAATLRPPMPPAPPPVPPPPAMPPVDQPRTAPPAGPMQRGSAAAAWLGNESLGAARTEPGHPVVPPRPSRAHPPPPPGADATPETTPEPRLQVAAAPTPRPPPPGGPAPTPRSPHPQPPEPLQPPRPVQPPQPPSQPPPQHQPQQPQQEHHREPQYQPGYQPHYQPPPPPQQQHQRQQSQQPPRPASGDIREAADSPPQRPAQPPPAREAAPVPPPPVGTPPRGRDSLPGPVPGASAEDFARQVRRINVAATGGYYDFVDILGMTTEEVTMPAARKKYKELMLILHPDKRRTDGVAKAGGKEVVDRAMDRVLEALEKAKIYRGPAIITRSASDAYVHKERTYKATSGTSPWAPAQAGRAASTAPVGQRPGGSEYPHHQGRGPPPPPPPVAGMGSAGPPPAPVEPLFARVLIMAE